MLIYPDRDVRRNTQLAGFMIILFWRPFLTPSWRLYPWNVNWNSITLNLVPAGSRCNTYHSLFPVTIYFLNFCTCQVHLAERWYLPLGRRLWALTDEPVALFLTPSNKSKCRNRKRCIRKRRAVISRRALIGLPKLILHWQRFGLLHPLKFKRVKVAYA